MLHPVLLFADEEPASAFDILAVVLFVVGIVVIAILLTASVRGKIAHRQAARPSPREQIEQIKSAGHKRSRETGPTAADVEQVRHLAIVLDNKAERLEQLIAQADARIATLQRTIAEHSEAESFSHVDQHEHDAKRAAASPPRGSTHTSPMNDAQDPIPNDETLDPFTRSVYEMADDGFSPIEIARELDEQVGKIDLILALRQQ